MKLTAAQLRDFLSLLPHYERLPLTARRAFVSIERPSQTCTAEDLRTVRDALVDSGFLLPSNERGRCSVAPLRQNFIRVLRVLRGHPVFQAPKQPTFSGYMEEHLTAAEREILRGGPAGYTERNWLLFRHVTSPDWVEDFLSAANVDWEKPYLTPGAPPLFSSAKVLSTTQSLIQWLLDHGGRAGMHELPSSSPDPELLSAALHAALRYALLFAALDPDTLDVLVGVWPAIAAYIALSATPPPRKVVPAKTFQTAFLMEDMTALLIACATEPLRLRANDGQLFAKTVRELSNTLQPLPQWVEHAFQMEPETRLHTTAGYVRLFGFVEEKGVPPSRMAISARGRHWLGLSVGERQRVLVDGVLDRRQTVAAFQDFQGAQIGAVAPRVHVSTSVESPPDIDAAVMQPFRSLHGDGFFPIEEIVASSGTLNPLLAIFRQDKNASFSLHSGYLNRPDAEKLQQLWSEVVRGFLRSRLLPLGSARLGQGKEGLSIAIAPAGRYFLGQTRDWEWSAPADSQVIVQPNFEVMFLGDAPGVEAEIGRFAERRGRQMGVLFQITKRSIFAAAAAGMAEESVLEILERVCTREVPNNVRREIHGWFAQCRKVCFESAMLIRCPDRETALRIIGLAKGSAVALNDTVLEYKDPGKQRTGLIKKLKDMGMLVSVQEEAARAPIRRTKRRWGRW